MKNLLLTLATFMLALNACTNKAISVKWISTTDQEAWQTSEIIAKNSTQTEAIQVFPEKLQQEIFGFGACFNELGWEALNLLPEAQKLGIIKEFFDTIDGCKYNICRMPIGANDYSVDWYSLDEIPGDFNMEQFSIDRDLQRLIPYIHEAQKFHPDLKIWASPWCPPAWLKTNNHYACRPDVVNDLPPSGAGQEMVTQFRMQPEYLKAYALYFSKFIDAYKNEGIEISAVHVQNEMNSCQNFPSCIWRPEDLATFIGSYLGPQLMADHPETEIWLGTIERPQIERIDPILTNPEASKYIKGAGFQWAGKDAIPLVHQKYSSLKLMQTESECGFGSNDWAAAEHTFDLMKHYFANGANAYMYWNMVLNETGKSQWGWKQNSLVTIDSNTKEVKYNPEFYLMKHFSAFVEAGSHKIETSDENCIAFKNSGSVVIFYYNNGEAAEKSFEVGSSSINASLKAKSLNTFIIEI